MVSLEFAALLKILATQGIIAEAQRSQKVGTGLVERVI